MLYFDSAYVAKCYLNDPDADAVRALVRDAVPLYSSALCVPEVSSALYRRYREGYINRRQFRELETMFQDDLRQGTWTLVPVSDAVLQHVAGCYRSLSPGVFLRAADAIHLASAVLAGFQTVWTSDRHLLQSARHFGLKGRSAAPLT